MECSHKEVALIDIDSETKQFQCPSCGEESAFIPVITGRALIHHGLLSVEVDCPFCWLKHYHSPQPLPDLRRSHCVCCGELMERHPGFTGGSYYIKEVVPGRHEAALEAYRLKWEEFRSGRPILERQGSKPPEPQASQETPASQEDN
jgi:hypothetical protein